MASPHPPLTRSPFPSRGRLKLETVLRRNNLTSGYKKLAPRERLTVEAHHGELTKRLLLEEKLSSAVYGSD